MKDIHGLKGGEGHIPSCRKDTEYILLESKPGPCQSFARYKHLFKIWLAKLKNEY